MTNNLPTTSFKIQSTGSSFDGKGQLLNVLFPCNEGDAVYVTVQNDYNDYQLDVSGEQLTSFDGYYIF